MSSTPSIEPTDNTAEQLELSQGQEHLPAASGSTSHLPADRDGSNPGGGSNNHPGS